MRFLREILKSDLRDAAATLHEAGRAIKQILSGLGTLAMSIFILLVMASWPLGIMLILYWIGNAIFH